VEAAVALVSTEQLVAAVSREGHGDMFAGQPRQQGRGDGRRIGKGLVVEVGESPSHLDRLCAAEVELGVLGAQVLGHGSGVGRLVVLGGFEADREGADLAPGALPHQGHHGARVDAAGEERSQRDVGDETALDGIPEPLLELVHGLLEAALERLRVGL
jgi:hypothetical protein